MRKILCSPSSIKMKDFTPGVQSDLKKMFKDLDTKKEYLKEFYLNPYLTLDKVAFVNEHACASLKEFSKELIEELGDISTLTMKLRSELPLDKLLYAENVLFLEYKKIFQEKKNSKLFCKLDKKLRENMDFVLELLKINRDIFFYLSDNFYRDSRVFQCVFQGKNSGYFIKNKKFPKRILEENIHILEKITKNNIEVFHYVQNLNFSDNHDIVVYQSMRSRYQDLLDNYFNDFEMKENFDEKILTRYLDNCDQFGCLSSRNGIGKYVKSEDCVNISFYTFLDRYKKEKSILGKNINRNLTEKVINIYE